MTVEPMPKLPRGLFPKSPKAPAHLGVPGRRLWTRVVEGWTLEPAHLAILNVACTAIDRAEQARAEVERRGLVLVGSRGGAIANPATSIERESMRTALRAIRELGLDIDVAGRNR
jgi:P27 family predicted phage terminase small subunit